jgi:hypothetical protein
MTIYLYVKTHRKTGLKYLGKTVQDPQQYHGSGKYWKKHLRVHGYDVETEILRECNSDEEIREWGLYYSELWSIVDARDEHGNKIWANLKEEAGDGFTSEQSRQNNLKRVANGTHHMLGGEIQRQRVANGTHPWTSGESQRQTALKRLADGTHHFCNSEFRSQIQQKRVADGTHHWLSGEIQKQNALKRVADGTHNMLGGEIQKQNALKRVADGTHQFQTPWTCSHCGKSGNGIGNFIRWHGENCKNK